MFFNELKVLVFMRSDSRQSGSDSERRSSAMRGLGMGGCGWPSFVDCHSRDDEEEYYGSDPRPRSLAFEDKEPKLQVGLDAVSLASTASSMRTPQCRICFQGPEQVNTTFQASIFSPSTIPGQQGRCLISLGSVYWSAILSPPSPSCQNDLNQ